jgi:hypothetical protein
MGDLMSHICRDCLCTVPAGEAVMRSVTFRPVAYCRACWEQFHADRPSIVPMPRESTEDLPRKWYSLRRARSRTSA